MDRETKDRVLIHRGIRRAKQQEADSNLQMAAALWGGGGGRQVSCEVEASLVYKHSKFQANQGYLTRH